MAHGRRVRAPGRYGSFPTTADVGIWARGRPPARLLEALGRALYAQIADLRGIRLREERRVAVEAADVGGLAVAYLHALLLLQQDDGFIGRSVAVDLAGTPPTRVTARIRGERFDPARHHGRIEVKAVTFHRLQVDLDRGVARVILDI